MKFAITIIVTLFSAQAFAQSPVTLKQVFDNKERTGVYPLDQGYRGEFTKRFDEDGRDKNGLDSQPFEFTHALLASSKHRDNSNEDLPPNKIVVGRQRPILTGGFAYRAPTVAVARMPSFEEFTKLENISDYECIFGKFRGFTDSWGLNGELHSSLFWMGFTELDDGKIRVVSVFLHTENKSDGWKISTRRVREGVFRPTQKPPVLEKAEPPVLEKVEPPVPENAEPRDESKSR